MLLACVIRWFRFLHTLILSMPASTWSWSTCFRAWTTLLLLHTCPDIAFNISGESIFYDANSISLFHTTRSRRKMICCISGCVWASGSEKLQIFLRSPFYSLLGSLQRLCDTKGQTTQCWKCHKHHSSLYSITDEKIIGIMRYYVLLQVCFFVVVFVLFKNRLVKMRYISLNRCRQETAKAWEFFSVDT